MDTYFVFLRVSLVALLLSGATGMAVAFSPQAQDGRLEGATKIEVPSRPLVFAIPFDEDVGLWRQQGGGHTSKTRNLVELHSGRVAAEYLFLAGYLDALDTVQATRVIKALRKLQCRDGSDRHGSFRWYSEETWVEDTNAAFFIGMPLIALDITAGHLLEPEAKAVLNDIFSDLGIWFEKSIEKRVFFYPNKYMGDIACAWLLQERVSLNEASLGKLKAAMREAADYWENQHWGWGEHMSDIYGGVLIDQLSMLLLLSRSFPDDLREIYSGLFHDLLAIEDAFHDGPRVPVIRSYAGKGISRVGKYRTRVRPWTGGDVQKMLARPSIGFAPGDLFYRLDWHKLAGPRASMKERVEVPCYGGAVARAWVTPQARLGTMSKYPIMDNTKDLAWQNMPVAFSAGSDGWGFLRWLALEGGVEKRHPALNQADGARSRSLTNSIRPAPEGRTWALQEGPDAIVVRQMPAIASAWETFADQLILTGSVFTIVKNEPGAKISRLLFSANGTPVTVFCIPLNGNANVRLARKDGMIAWEAVRSAIDMKRLDHLTTAWIFCWGRDVNTDSVLMPREDYRPGGRQIPEDKCWTLNWPRRDKNVSVIWSPFGTPSLQGAEAMFSPQP